MIRNPSKRLGSGSKDAEEIKSHPFFEGLSWEDVYQRKMKVPKPVIKNVNCCESIWISDSPAVEGIDKIEGWDFLADQ